MIRMAVEQFLPSAGAGALLTVVLTAFVPGALWMLPGLWQITFSLGVFSSCRFLPRLMPLAGVWYLATGLFCVALGVPRLFTLGHGHFLRSGTVAGGRHSAVHTRRRPQMKSKAQSGEGRFAYEGLDRVIHERARLSVLTSLITNTRGPHLRRPEAVLLPHRRQPEPPSSRAGGSKMVEIVKGATRTGRTPSAASRLPAAAHLDYLETLEQVVQRRRQAAKEFSVQSGPWTGAGAGLNFFVHRLCNAKLVANGGISSERFLFNLANGTA